MKYLFNKSIKPGTKPRPSSMEFQAYLKLVNSTSLWEHQEQGKPPSSIF